MTDADIDEAKAALRLRAHAQRQHLARAHGADAALQVAQFFFEGAELKPGETVALYWPIRDEMDCRPVLGRLMDNGHRVCLPAVLGDDQPLALRLWEPDAPLYPAGFGTLAPLETAPVVEPDLVILPLLGFDASGTRLGYGKGHYDRTLAAMSKPPRLVGFAFSEQEFEHIPRGPHDVPLDAVVTEAGFVRFPARAVVS